MITRTRLLAGVAGLAILASACGGTAQPAPTTAPTVAPTLAATLAPTVAPTPTKLVVAATGQGATVVKVTENKVALADGSAPYVPAGAYVSTVVLLTLEKGGRTPAHRHAGVEAIFVLEGTIDFRTAGGGRVILRAGQGSAVPPNTAVQAVNGGDGVAKVLAFLMIQENAPFQTNTDEAP
jgi:quercetin dioxygenase-like cupin family protein